MCAYTSRSQSVPLWLENPQPMPDRLSSGMFGLAPAHQKGPARPQITRGTHANAQTGQVSPVRNERLLKEERNSARLRWPTFAENSVSRHERSKGLLICYLIIFIHKINIHIIQNWNLKTTLFS